ncbi:hypothetical protein KILIM_078_00200 [Kineosphaera limosa NBRC 100340]|uniref:DUF6602 domain-containing protein n=1 Tax=Kineosphaera limosa NBRC 100340 TaxID=1184609 RepID=K6VN84_9MICO|nr:DUF6602 domain-containing protein [Kineosphaera limosa]GAB97688.1 hypothetical protein KILIM_078_00200 [Kineosphaera limosa NBRC 100340]
MTSRFQDLFRELATRVETDYSEAREHARQSDPQRAGHEGEATWQTLIDQWGPGLPVVTRKYIVGPGGESNEVDLVILKRDYPAHLMSHSSVLASGVAAAFSVKLTLKRTHVREAIEQKKTLVRVAGEGGSPKHFLAGHFPFGLLSHSTELFASASSFADSMIDLYEEVAHGPTDPAATDPRHELDSLLVADAGFFRTFRSTLSPIPNSDQPWSPMTSFNRYSTESQLPGIHIAHFVSWLGSQLSNDDAFALQSLEPLFEGNSTSGYMTHWPISIYPEHIQKNINCLLNDYGMPLSY